jgi:hypothetical protein
MKRLFGALLVVAGLILLPAVAPGAGLIPRIAVTNAASGPSLTSETFQQGVLTMTDESQAPNGGGSCPSAAAMPANTICRTDQIPGGSTCDTIFNSTSTYNFAATGTAKGPVNGTYTENGTFQIQYDGNGNPTLSSFSATFQLSSGGGSNLASGSLSVQPADSNPQYTSTPDALITGYCNGFGVPVIEGMVTYYNAQVSGSGVTGQTDIQLTGTAGSNGPTSDGFTETFNWTATTGTCWTSNDTNFNGTALPVNSTLWAPAVIKLQGPKPTSPVTFNFYGGSVTFPSGASYSVPSGTLTVSPTATTSTTTYSAGGGWQTTVPASVSGNTFAAGVAIPLPSGLAGSQKPVTWSMQITSSAPGWTVHWQWSAAGYSSFNTDYTQLGVKPVDDSSTSQYKNSDKAGTPESYKTSVIGGGTGVGGTNYTGSLSDTAHCTF